MSLTSFIQKADVKAKLKPLRPGPPRKIPAALAVEPRSKRNQMVGTAFDYLLRFELQRRAPHSVARCWTAEAAPDLIWKKTDRGGGWGLTLYRDDRGVVSVARDAQSATAAVKQESGLAQGMADRARKVIETAKLAHSAYLKTASPTRSDQADVAGHAIRLAKLTALVASRWQGFDPTFEEAAGEDVEDLLALLAIVPFNALLHDTTLLLNPVFKEASLLVGSEADLISGDTLVDFKTTMKSSMTTENLDELFGYYLLARRQRQADPTFPAINRLALYFGRHGYLWAWDVSTWTGHPQFAETEEWFFNRAKERIRAKEPEAPPDPDALAALKKQFEENPRLLWVSRSNPQGTEWTIKRPILSPGGSLFLPVVRSGAGPQRILYLEAHRLVADGTLRFDGGANQWRLEMSEI